MSNTALQQTENEFDPTGAVEYSRDERAVENEYDEVENPEFDPQTGPTELECNVCGWNGYPTYSTSTFTDGHWLEMTYCPSCREYHEAEEWNIVSADPFEQPLEDGLPDLSQWIAQHGEFPLLQALVEARKTAGRQAGRAV